MKSTIKQLNIFIIICSINSIITNIYQKETLTSENINAKSDTSYQKRKEFLKNTAEVS